MAVSTPPPGSRLYPREGEEITDARVTFWSLWDLDGALGDHSHREHLLTPKTPGATRSQHPFHEAQDQDEIMSESASVLIRWKEESIWHRVAIITSAPVYYRHARAEWLKEWALWGLVDEMYMRSHNDLRPSEEVKRDIVQERFLNIPDRVVAFAVDDRPKIIEMYRSLGITAYYPLEVQQL